jgi:hypothetical protein
MPMIANSSCVGDAQDADRIVQNAHDRRADGQIAHDRPEGRVEARAVDQLPRTEAQFGRPDEAELSWLAAEKDAGGDVEVVREKRQSRRRVAVAGRMAN